MENKFEFILYTLNKEKFDLKLKKKNAREISGCFPRGKRAATVRRYPVLFLSCVQCFRVFHTTGCEAYSFTTDGYGIFNMRTYHIWVRAVRYTLNEADQAQTSPYKRRLGRTEKTTIYIWRVRAQKQQQNNNCISDACVRKKNKNNKKHHSDAHPAPPGDRSQGQSLRI